MDWTSGYTSKWRVMYVDPNTWADLYKIEGIDSVKIARDCSEETPLLESAQFTVTQDIDEDFPYGWYRIEMIATQAGSSELVALGTFLVDRTSENFDHNSKLVSLSGHSVLYPATKMFFEDGSYVPRGMQGPVWCKKRLDETLPYGIRIEVKGESFTLNDYLVYSANDNYLKVIWAMLDTSGWCIQLDGWGNIYILEIPDHPTFSLDHYRARIIQPGITRERDLSDIPNVFKVVTEDEVVEVENNDPPDISEVSIPARLGLRFYEQEVNPTLINGESPKMYAIRRLRALSVSETTISYNREFDPDVYLFDKIEGYIRGFGPVEEMMIERQDIECEDGIIVDEQSGIVRGLWSGETD